MQLPQKNILLFQKKILAWYEKNKRNLPWRKDRDPYHILVSELMLQQTQVIRVIPKYASWMKAFPDIHSLAKASTRDVLFHWSGLGYNRRALYLKKCAEELVYSSREQSGSRSFNNSSSRLRSNNKITWPQDEKELMKLPGVGKYTARALLCFAFNKQVVVVDTNVRKVILIEFKHVILSGAKDLDSSAMPQNDSKIIEDIAEQLLPKGKAYEWNQALMDYAASELKNHKIPIPKQSKFKDSDRYYRGMILRLLLQNTYTEKKLYQQLGGVSIISPDRYQNILSKLLREGIIQKQKEAISLPAV